MKAAHIVGATGINKTRRLLAIDLLVKIAVEEGILDIKLVDRPRTGDRNGEDDADGGRFDNRAERLVEVDARLLGVATDHPPSLIPSQPSIRMEFMLEDPLP